MKPHLGSVTSFLRPFRALRQPVQVTWCRKAFFYLWKGGKEYESEMHLPGCRTPFDYNGIAVRRIVMLHLPGRRNKSHRSRKT